MQQCMAKVGHIFGGGGLGGVAHLTQNNVALQKDFFFLTVGTGLN